MCVMLKYVNMKISCLSCVATFPLSHLYLISNDSFYNQIYDDIGLYILLVFIGLLLSWDMDFKLRKMFQLPLREDKGVKRRKERERSLVPF